MTTPSLRRHLPLLVMIALALATLAVPFLTGGQREPAGRVFRARPVDVSGLKEASWYRKLDGGEVECTLCPTRCLLADGEVGECRVRENVRGTLYSLVYGKPCALSVEPIEKAPFYHFLPGSTRLCVATVGCNLRCSFCQNWQISQSRLEEVEHRELAPEAVVSLALERGVRSICFTFSEPVVFYEYMRDIATAARRQGLRTVMVSSGYINQEPLRELLGVLDAVKIDLKGFTASFYEEIVGGRLEPVLESIRTVAASGVWLEIVNLVIPTLNDDAAEIGRMCAWIREAAGPEVPLHFTRFHPDYRLTDLPPTPVETLEAAHRIATEAGLRHVYVGNVPGHPLDATRCPVCGSVLVERQGFYVLRNHLDRGRCASCRTPVAGVWE